MTLKHTLRNKYALACLFLLVLNLVTLGLLAYQNQKQWQRTNDVETKLISRMAQANTSSHARDRAHGVVWDTGTDFVYLPEFRIKLPFTPVSKSLTYEMRGEFDELFTGNPSSSSQIPEADLYSTHYIYPQQPATADCGVMVRIKLEAKPDAYSPHEKPSTVKLADGRTLQVYESVDEKSCQRSWDSSVSPSVVAKQLQRAQSY